MLTYRPSTVTSDSDVDLPGTTSEPALPGPVYWLSTSLAFVGAIAAALTFFIEGVLTGPAVTNGNARGTALVMLLSIPLMLAAMRWVARGSYKATLVWTGVLFYLFYNSFLLLFLTPFNRLFLLYVSTFSLAIFATLALLKALEMRELGRRFASLPVKGLAAYVWTIVALNLFAWMQVVVDATFADDPGSFLDGTGVATNPIYVQDLALWLPLMAVSSWWLWQRRPLGILLTGSWLVFGVIESIGIAVDQWFGHQADPTSPLASNGVIVIFVTLALVGIIPLYFIFRKGKKHHSADGR